MTEILNWFLNLNLLEVFGVITGTLCVYLAAKNNILNWPTAIVSVVIYIFIFYDARLYADMGLQVYFLGMNIYGWYYWSRRTTEHKVPIASITKKQLLLSFAGVVFFTLILGTLLYRSTDASFPYIDSFCTACSLIAQVFLARKVLQNWLIWILVDAVYVGVYISKDLYLTAGMYALYIYIAALGFIEWRRELQKQAIIHGE
jgi:nicotinamide mononucleotide transporter